MADAIFEDERLAAIYDPLDADRSDLDVYVAIVEELGATSILDVGCGTGTFACRLALQGIEVTAVDPAVASLEVARRKPGAELVRWVAGDAAATLPVQVDLVTMTANVAQVFVTDDDLASTLSACRSALRSEGRLVFEVRDPARERWREWTHDESFRCLDLPGIGPLETWVELTDVSLPLVSFRWTFAFERTGDVLTSDSTLRFRNRSEIETALTTAGFVTIEVCDAPDRPGHELVFVARPG